MGTSRSQLSRMARSSTLASLLATVLLVGQVGAASAGLPQEEPGGPVCTSDVPFASHLRDRDQVPAVHADAVDCAAFLGIAKGMPLDEWSVHFQPAATVTRGAMASFVARTLGAAGVLLPAPSPERFDDVAGSAHDDAVHRLRAAGVVSGRSQDAFSPGDPVTRGQTSSFLLRAVAFARGTDAASLERPDSPFTDVAGSVHEGAVGGTHALGLVEGVTPTAYDPGGDTTRAQMATLVVRLLESEVRPVDPCTNDEADYTARPPVTWSVNRGDTLPPCSAFDPEPIEVRTGTDDTRELAVLLRDEAVTYEEALTPAPGHGSVVDREQTLTLGGRRAALQERTATGQGLHPEGGRSTMWLVDRGDHTLIGETHDVAGRAYAAHQGVLARMLLSLELPEPDRTAFSSPETVDTAPHDGNGLGLVDVRTGRHDGFDRVVLQLAGDGTIGWRVAYTDDPRYQGSGHPVDVAGGTTLQVMLDGVGYPGDTGVDPYDGPDRLAGPGTAVQEVVVGNVFEGQHGAFLGVREPLPYRVFRLSDPARVVLDVQHQPAG